MRLVAFAISVLALAGALWMAAQVPAQVPAQALLLS